MLHAGGILNDATLHNQTPAHVRSVFAPKTAGATALLRVRKTLLWLSTAWPCVRQLLWFLFLDQFSSHNH